MLFRSPPSPPASHCIRTILLDFDASEQLQTSCSLRYGIGLGPPNLSHQILWSCLAPVLSPLFGGLGSDAVPRVRIPLAPPASQPIEKTSFSWPRQSPESATSWPYSRPEESHFRPPTPCKTGLFSAADFRGTGLAPINKSEGAASQANCSSQRAGIASGAVSRLSVR